MVGAKGGVGASTVAHNVAWTIARDLALDSVVIDLDLAFGTAGLDYNQDPVQGIANAVFSPDRPDTALMERLLAKCTEHLSLLAAPATLERVYDFGAEAFDAIFDTLRMTTPCIVLDVPHQWSAWTRRALVSADDIVIVAEPDLANLRNTKNMLNVLKTARPNDRPPLYCINQVGMPKRPEIERAANFAKTMESQPIAVDSVRFEDVRHRRQQRPDDRGSLREPPHHQDVPQMASRLTGRGEVKKPQRSLLAPIMKKLQRQARTRMPRRAAQGVDNAASASSMRARSLGGARITCPLRWALLLARQQPPQIGDVCRRLSGGRSAFTMLSASAIRPCSPTTSARFGRTRGSASLAL